MRPRPLAVFLSIEKLHVQSVKLGRQLVVGKINHAEFRIPSNQALWTVSRVLS